jgi:hypothetical protein
MYALYISLFRPTFNLKCKLGYSIQQHNSYNAIYPSCFYMSLIMVHVVQRYRLNLPS